MKWRAVDLFESEPTSLWSARQLLFWFIALFRAVSLADHYPTTPSANSQF
jgi:hypothetical protein